MMHRRDFLTRTAQAAGGLALVPLMGMPSLAASSALVYKISLAQWSLHKALFAGEMKNLDFAKVAKNDYGIEAIEYVNVFFMDKAQDQAYLTEMKTIAEGEGVHSVLIMCDREGNLGDPEEAKRKQAVENHHKWVEAAQFLGCHAIRVNARSDASLSYEEQQRLAADGLRHLCVFADPFGIEVIVENHGGLSSNGQWLAGVMEMVDHPRVGTLPDFGNFQITEGEWYDRYKGVRELMPYAKAVSAKSNDFHTDGLETNTDYVEMMNIVLEAGYRGYVGIEYEGQGLSEPDGIRATKTLLERVRTQIGGAYE